MNPITQAFTNVGNKLAGKTFVNNDTDVNSAYSKNQRTMNANRTQQSYIKSLQTNALQKAVK